MQLVRLTVGKRPSRWYYHSRFGDKEEGHMATIEQVRERQQEILDRFNTQSVPAYRGQLTESAKRAVVNAVQASTAPRRRSRRNVTLPMPSNEVRAFLIRAMNDSNFRRMMERLVNE